MEAAVDTDSRKRARDDSNSEDDDADNAHKKLLPDEDAGGGTNGVDQAAAAAEAGTEPANVALASSDAEEPDAVGPGDRDEAIEDTVNPDDGENGKLSGDENQATEAKLGPKLFSSAVDMFNYFHDLARNWPVNCNVNKYEFLMLEDLLKKGHEDPEKKIGAGIEAFQVRVNPMFYSRCYYVIRKDGSMDDFSYRKCVDNILPLPAEFKTHFKNKREGGGGQQRNRGRGGRRGGLGRGNRGGSRF